MLSISDDGLRITSEALILPSAICRFSAARACRTSLARWSARMRCVSPATGVVTLTADHLAAMGVVAFLLLSLTIVLA
jgi:hypothetical protein